MFKILSIDGGGIRGIYPAYILKRIEEELKIKVNEYFDMIVGTSTGSIIASAVATNYPLTSVVELFEKKGKEIFKKNNFNFCRARKSKYKIQNLKEILELILGNRTFSDIEQKLVITATDVGNGNVFVFKSQYLKEFVRDTNIKVAEAVLASCAAPTYFNPQKVKTYLLADGGLWANNPSMVALTEALGKLQLKREDIKLMSIGTGFENVSYKKKYNKKNWGFLNAWSPRAKGKFYNFILSIQTKNAEESSRLILRDNFLKINFETDQKLPLDDISFIDDIKSKADQTFTYNVKKIENFLK